MREKENALIVLIVKPEKIFFQKILSTFYHICFFFFSEKYACLNYAENIWNNDLKCNNKIYI